MHVGVFLGPFSSGPQDDLNLIDFCLDQAVEACDAGFSMVTFGEQHFNNYEPYSNPFMMGARVAPFLKKTYLGTTAVPLPFHNPFRLAEQINLLDVMAKGQLVVGVSPGRPAGSSDHKNFGIDPQDRDEAFNSKMDFMLKAFAHKPGDEPLVIDTKWDRGQLDGRMMPISWRQPRPLLAHATNSESTIIKSAEKGWPFFMAPARPTMVRQREQLYRNAMLGAGYSYDEVTAALEKCLLTRHVFVADTDEAAWELAMKQTRGASVIPGAFGAKPLDVASAQKLMKVDLDAPGASDDPLFARIDALQSWIIAGTPETVIKRIQETHEGVEMQLLTRFAPGPYDIESWNRSFRLFVDEVLPALNSQTFESVERPIYNNCAAEIVPH